MPWTRPGTGAAGGCYELGPFAASHTVGVAGFFSAAFAIRVIGGGG